MHSSFLLHPPSLARRLRRPRRICFNGTSDTAVPALLAAPAVLAAAGSVVVWDGWVGLQEEL
jgi:hypothetical protein